jgi:hypothetical protein
MAIAVSGPMSVTDIKFTPAWGAISLMICLKRWAFSLKTRALMSFAAVQLGQRPAGLNVAKMRGQQQLALRRRDVKRFARAGGKDHVAIKLQLTAPAGDFIQHRVAEAHEMEKAVEPWGTGMFR